MEIHIHFWLGSELSRDDCNIALMKATELDEVLGGRTVLHRELEGHESSRFLSYFKQGMFIKCREIVGKPKLVSPSSSYLCYFSFTSFISIETIQLTDIATDQFQDDLKAPPKPNYTVFLRGRRR